jgi:malonyl-CoA/methylmalonyl-CoA synthetase
MGRLIDAFADRWRADPAAPALIAPGRAHLSRGGLDLVSARFAAALAAAGARPGDRVMSQTEKSPEALALYLACLRGGFAHLPLNPAYTDAELAYFVADAEPALAVLDPAREAAVKAAGVRTLTLDALGAGTLPAAAGPLAPAPVRPGPPEALAALLYTSGTTGRPKGAMLSHANLHANALALAGAWRMSADDALLHMLPIFHAHGLFVAAHLALLVGAPMLFEPVFAADRWFAALPRARVFMGVPTHYARLLADDRLTREATAHMRLFVSGSAPLAAAAFEAFAARTGHQPLERYGMTETAMLTSNPHDGPRVAGSVGPALPGVGLRVVDADGRDLPAGEVGEVEVRGPNVFSGYWRAPEKTAESFRPGGWFRTGDVGLLDAGGALTLVGRAKDVVITGGFNVYPREVEDALLEAPEVADAAVFGAPHPDWGETVVAAVELRPGMAASPGALREGLRERLAAYKLPKQVLILPALPRNAMGKVEKARLRAEHAALYAPPAVSPTAR